MSKNSVTKFDLEAAFKALDSVDYAASEKGLVARRQNLKESYSNLKENKSSMDILLEDYYDLESEEDLNDAADDRDGEVAKAKLTRIEKIVDLDAKTADELLPSYVGKVIIQCPQCMNLFYKNEEDIEKDPEDPTTCNVNEPCQHCGNISGYTLIGKVDAVDESEAAELTGETEEPDALDLDLDFDTEEEAPAEDEGEEGTAEETAEEENTEDTTEETDEDLDLDLDLNLESLNNSKLQKKCSDKTDLDTDNHSTNLTLNEELEDAVDESMNNSKLQKTCSEKTDLDTDNHSKNLTLNEELDDEDEEVNITVTEAKNDDTDYYRGFIEDACYFINDDGYFDIYGTDLTQKAQDIVDAFDAYIAKKKYGKAAKACVTAKDLEVVNTKEGKRIQIPGTVVEECVNSEAPVETTEACTEPVKENVASVLAAFEASLDDGEDFAVKGEFPEDESLNNNQKFKDISKKHCSENDSKNLTVNESLNEAVAITISVDEVEDQVMATEPCDAMVVSAQPAGVAGYTPEAPDFFCDFNDAEEFVAPEAPVAEIAPVEAPVGVAPEIEAEIADAATAAIAPEATVEEPVEDEANDNEDDNDDNDDDNTPEADGDADTEAEDEEVEESLDSVTKDTLKEFDDLNNQLYSELGIKEVTEDLETDTEKAIDELDELNAETAPAGAEEVADIDQDIADRDEVEDGTAEKADEALTEEAAPKADSASFKQMLNSETFKEFNEADEEEIDLESEELTEGVLDTIKRKFGDMKSAIKNKSVKSFAKNLAGTFTVKIAGGATKTVNTLSDAVDLASNMSKLPENKGKTIIVSLKHENGMSFERLVQYRDGKVTLDKVQDAVKAVKAKDDVDGTEAGEVASTGTGAQAQASPAETEQPAAQQQTSTPAQGDSAEVADAQSHTGSDHMDGTPVPPQNRAKAIQKIKDKLEARGIDLDNGKYDDDTNDALIELRNDLKDEETPLEELQADLKAIVDAYNKYKEAKKADKAEKAADETNTTGVGTEEPVDPTDNTTTGNDTTPTDTTPQDGEKPGDTQVEPDPTTTGETEDTTVTTPDADTTKVKAELEAAMKRIEELIKAQADANEKIKKLQDQKKKANARAKKLRDQLAAAKTPEEKKKIETALATVQGEIAVLDNGADAVANGDNSLDAAEINNEIKQNGGQVQIGTTAVATGNEQNGGYIPSDAEIEGLKGALIDADNADMAAVAQLIVNSGDQELLARIRKLFDDEMERNKTIAAKNAKSGETLNASLTHENYKRIAEALIADSKFTIESLEECDETKIEECLKESLTAVYDNVSNFSLIDCSINDGKFIVEGLITFASGKTRETKYEFNEAYKVADSCKLVGTNKLLDQNGTFVLEGKLLTGNNLITESFSYKYHEGTELVEGLIRK